MPPSDPTCPTCGTQVRANDYWSYLAGPSSPRVYYPKSIMDDNPEIAGTFTRCADPFHAAPSDPAACPNCTSPQRGVRYSDDPGALCGHSWHDKPSDPAAVPPPEWAQKAVASVIVRRLVDGELPDDGTDGLYALARLLASVREGALREAAQTCFDRALSLNAAADHARATMGDDCPIWSRHSENEAGRLGHAILALLDTPPSGGV